MSTTTKYGTVMSTTTKYWWCAIHLTEDGEYESQEYHLIVSAEKPKNEQILQIVYNAQYNKEDDEWFKPWGTEQRVAVGILDEITKEDFTVFEKRFGTWQFANFKQETFTRYVEPILFSIKN